MVGKNGLSEMKKHSNNKSLDVRELHSPALMMNKNSSAQVNKVKSSLMNLENITKIQKKPV